MKAEHGHETEAEVIDFEEMVASAALTFPPEKSRPRWGVYDEPVTFNGKRHRPGVYYHIWVPAKGEIPEHPVDTWISGPVHLVALRA